ncbi:hypothetical protein VTP01DRAFT_9508 [Rhizomucor pusillus]|uniref:uncharacterized protein n=1 Tax=Rhizomucor pusillus TaxID=4840 RepID=UPI003742BD13
MAASKAIVWSPRSGSNRFLVSGSDLKLYDWIPATRDLAAKAQLVSNIPNVTLVMCADWSSDPSRPDLVAAGLATGKTLLLRLQDYGLTDVDGYHDDGLISSPMRTQMGFNTKGGSKPQYSTLNVKMSRSCNVVSFCKQQPQLLAAGLDKVRNDPCLLIWDISQSIDSYCSTPASGSQTPTAASVTPHSSSYQFPRADNNDFSKISSDIVFSDRSRYNVGISNPDQFIPSSSAASGNFDQKPIQQYGSSEGTSSCAWSTHAGSPLLIAGMAYKYLRVYDIRENSAVNPLQFMTKAVYGVSVDPFNPYRVASYTEEGVVKLWDLRNPNDSVLTLNSESGAKQGLSGISFSPSKEGLLATLAKDSTDVMFWNIQESGQLYVASTAGEQPYVSDALPFEDVPTVMDTKRENLKTLVLWKSRKVHAAEKSFAAFSFVPTLQKSFEFRDPSKTQNQQVVLLQKDGQFVSAELAEPCSVSWNSSGDILLTNGEDLISCGVEKHPEHRISMETKLQGLRIDGAMVPTLPAEDKLLAASLTSMDIDGSISELANDISVVMRKRAENGYSMKCGENIAKVGNDYRLRELWSWMDKICKRVESNGQLAKADIGFQGVYGLWSVNEMQGRKISKAVSEASPDPNRSRDTNARGAKVEIEEQTLAMVETSKRPQRLLALEVCGQNFSRKDLERELRRLETMDQYDKAAALALFSGLRERAIEALGSTRGSGKDEQQRKLLSGVLAGFQPEAQVVNPTWRQLCESLSNDMDDRPYLKAIFAYIASRDWRKVLDEEFLPLRERVAVALRVLSDEQMTNFLEDIVSRAVEEGDVECLFVTGLTSRGVDLLERMVDRYGDIQTASLVMSFVVPRRFKDRRVEEWIESYRNLLDRWQLWHARANFDIERGQRMSNSNEIVPPQVYVRCTFCSQSLGHSLLIQNIRNREGKRVNLQANVSPVSSGGGRTFGRQKPTVCPSCRKPLPRCALCLLHLGTPIDPLRKAIVASDQQTADPSGFDLWFTWCQTCRHGGHAMHMFDWFQKHTTCPVSNCSCQCFIATPDLFADTPVN